MAEVTAALLTANTAAQNLTALQSAETSAGASGVVVLPAGRYNLSGYTCTLNDVRYAGRGRPRDTGTQLAGGTSLVMTGQWNIDGKIGVTLEDFGIEAGGGDSIRSGTSSAATADQWLTIRNIATINTAAAVHGCVLTSGSRNRVDQFYARGFTHGLALRSSLNLVDNVHLKTISDWSIIIKAEELTVGNVFGNVVNGVIMDGTGSVGFFAEGTCTCEGNIIYGFAGQGASYAVRITQSGAGIVRRNLALGGVARDSVFNTAYTASVGANVVSNVIAINGPEGFEAVTSPLMEWRSCFAANVTAPVVGDHRGTLVPGGGIPLDPVRRVDTIS